MIRAKLISEDIENSINLQLDIAIFMVSFYKYGFLCLAEALLPSHANKKFPGFYILQKFYPLQTYCQTKVRLLTLT